MVCSLTRAFRCTLLALGFTVGIIAAALAAADPQADEPQSQDAPAPQAAARGDAEPPAALEQDQPDTGYYDEPPLDYYQRAWRWRTRQFTPQRFSRRDLRRQFGYDPPYYPPSYVWPGRYGAPPAPYAYPYTPYTDFSTQAYLQGRYDERRFSQWKEHHDKGEKAYTLAMQEGVRLFREGEYTQALGEFVRAAELNQGDPASRVHATYALVAIGNYDDAVLMIRRAIQLQSRLMYLPLSIREEYGVAVDFDAHRRRLREAVARTGDDAGLWMLWAYYAYFSGDKQDALAAIEKAHELAPQDRLIDEFRKAISLTTPTNPSR